MKVYLAGPINGKSDGDCFGWRVRTRRALAGAEFLDPMDRDFRGQEEGRHVEIVTSDEADIRSADVVFVYAVAPSWGTAMEIRFAHDIGKRVIAYCPDERPSPWLVYHASVFRSFREALEAV